MNPGTVAVGWLDDGRWSACFGQSLLDLCLVDATIGSHRIVPGGVKLRKYAGANGIVAGRNDVAAKFLDTECEWLFMVDADMGFGPTTVDDLIAAADPKARPVVGGLCFALRQDRAGVFYGDKFVIVPTVYRWVDTDDATGFQSILDVPENAMMEVSATGAACLLAHRSALERVRAKYGDHWFDPLSHPAGPTFSEDLSFCIRLAALDIPMWVHTGVGTTHDKGGVFLDRDAYDRQMAARPLAPTLPTFAVVASRDRPEMLETLRAQLEGQVTDTFVFDNGYSDEEAPALAILAHDWPLHRMWNTGLDMAEKAAAGEPFNVIVINDDVEVPDDFAAQLETALRAHPDHWVAYPNHTGRLPLRASVRTSTDLLAGQTMSGWAFMLRGEAGLRFDERFAWLYGDSDLERQVRQAGKFVVCAGGCFAAHLDPVRSTVDDPERVALAVSDEARFAEKWGVPPDSLWLARRSEAAV